MCSLRHRTKSKEKILGSKLSPETKKKDALNRGGKPWDLNRAQGENVGLKTAQRKKIWATNQAQQQRRRMLWKPNTQGWKPWTQNRDQERKAGLKLRWCSKNGTLKEESVGLKVEPNNNKEQGRSYKDRRKVGLKTKPNKQRKHDMEEISGLQKYLAIKSEMKNLEGLEHFLGIKVALS